MMPHRKRKKEKLNHAYEFELICLLARRCDAEGVRRILRRGNCIALRQNMLTPVMQMAIEGNDRAVWMLIHEFDASLQHAVHGYARAGRHDKVKELLALGASYSSAAWGYFVVGDIAHAHEVYLDFGMQTAAKTMSADEQQAFRKLLREDINDIFETDANKYTGVINDARKGDIRKVDRHLVDHFADIDDAVYGYASGGHLQQVENLISRGAKLKDAMQGYASAGIVDQVINLYVNRNVTLFHAVENFAENSLHRYIEHIFQAYDFKYETVRQAARGYENVGYFENEKIALRLLTLIRNDDLRVLISREAESFSHNPGRVVLQAKSLVKKARQVRKIMDEFQVNYDQALALTTPGLVTWLLQGQSLKISRDMYFKIASEIANASYDDVKVIAAAVAKNTYEGAVKSIEYKHAPGFFQRWGCCGYDEKRAKKNVREEIAELDERYQSPERRVGVRNP